jgi:uracil-DNA glycosylase
MKTLTIPRPVIGLERLLSDVRACTICAAHLPQKPRPVLQAGSAASILIAAQAPGRRVHRSGIPFDDASGDRLRLWMGVDKDVFHDPNIIAILPMGFCYPGAGGSGDLPPRPECALPALKARVKALRGAARS